MGVGINIQPNAVRELFDLGLTADILDTIGVPVKEWALVGLNGREVYAEARGLDAGYNWPQYAVHRGELHMLLYRTLIERAGKDSVVLDAKVDDYTKQQSGKVRWHSLGCSCSNASRSSTNSLGRSYNVAWYC